MQCYFNLINGTRVIADRKGVKVADFEQALQEAQSVIREMRVQDPRNRPRLGRLET